MFIASAVATAAGSAIVGDILGGSNGGSGGGNAPPVYIPKDQQGRDQNFLDNQSAYQNLYGNYFNNVVNPLSYQQLNAQFNNGTAPYYQQMAGNAGYQYQQNANNLSQASNSAYGNAANTANWGNLMQNGMVKTASPRVDQAFNQMMDMGNQSNAMYGQLMARQGGQAGNVYGSAQNLYGGGNAVMNTAFDPQNALYDRTRNQLVDQTRASEYARGIQMSPAGAAIENNALSNFNIDWQNQQLSRQSQGLQAASGAYGNALNQTTGWANNMSGLQSAQNQNYASLAEGATQMYGNWGQAQANVANTMANANAKNYATAATLGDQSAQSTLQAGQVPYQASETILANNQTGLQNYWNNMQPYGNSLNQAQSNDLGYMNFGQGAQNMAYNQNMQNQQWSNQMAQQYGGPMSQGINSAWNWLKGGNSGNAYDGSTGFGTGSNFGNQDYGINF